jgi:hypothetical protein
MRSNRLNAAVTRTSPSFVNLSAEGVMVTVRLRRRRCVCSRCAQTGRHLEIHDRRSVDAADSYTRVPETGFGDRPLNE